MLDIIREICILCFEVKIFDKLNIKEEFIMENYNLGPNEVVLYKGDVKLKDTSGSTELILTNINLVFINEIKKLFSKEEVFTFEYPIQSIKLYEGVPQIKEKGESVEIYLLETEIEIEFYSKTELHKFTNAAYKLLTGETSAQRGAKKIKDAISLVDDTLGINTVQITGNVLKNGIIGNITGSIGKIGKSVFGKNNLAFKCVLVLIQVGVASLHRRQALK